MSVDVSKSTHVRQMFSFCILDVAALVKWFVIGCTLRSVCKSTQKQFFPFKVLSQPLSARLLLKALNQVCFVRFCHTNTKISARFLFRKMKIIISLSKNSAALRPDLRNVLILNVLCSAGDKYAAFKETRTWSFTYTHCFTADMVCIKQSSCGPWYYSFPKPLSAHTSTTGGTKWKHEA